MMYSKQLKFSIVVCLVQCNRATSQSGSTVSVYEVSVVFRQKVRGAVDSIFGNINVNLSEQTNLKHCLETHCYVWKSLKVGTRGKNRPFH